MLSGNFRYSQSEGYETCVNFEAEHGALVVRVVSTQTKTTEKPQVLETTMSHHEHEACINACTECAAACDHCATACLAESHVKEMAECIRLDIDCAQICWIAAAYMSRGSSFANELCELCADVCEACGAECRKHDAEHCQECADACDRCAKECRGMVAAAA